MISIQGLNYSIGGQRILQDVDMRVGGGELIGIIGPNGAGKSSLLKLISKEYHGYDGEILVNGRDLKEYKIMELAKFRAVLPQSNYLAVNLKVLDIVMMGRYPHFNYKPSSEDIRIAKSCLNEMGMLGFQERMIFSLSGGEQQRVQLARVLAQIYQMKEGILLMDEPINGLDLEYQQVILEKAKDLAGLGMCVICVLHDINLAAQYADKILLLKNGKVKGFGPPEKVLTEEAVFEMYHTKVKRIEKGILGYTGILPSGMGL